MSIINATQWSVVWDKVPSSRKGKLYFRFWRPCGFAKGFEGTLLKPTESVRFPGVMFYGHEAQVFKWGYDDKRKTFFIWVQNKGGPVIVAPELSAYDGKSGLHPRKLFELFSKHCTRRVPPDQFPEPQRKPLRWPGEK